MDRAERRFAAAWNHVAPAAHAPTARQAASFRAQAGLIFAAIFLPWGCTCPISRCGWNIAASPPRDRGHPCRADVPARRHHPGHPDARRPRRRPRRRAGRARCHLARFVGRLLPGADLRHRARRLAASVGRLVAARRPDQFRRAVGGPALRLRLLDDAHLGLRRLPFGQFFRRADPRGRRRGDHPRPVVAQLRCSCSPPPS